MKEAFLERGVQTGLFAFLERGLFSNRSVCSAEIVALWDEAEMTNYHFEPGHNHRSLEKTVILIPLDGEEEE